MLQILEPLNFCRAIIIVIFGIILLGDLIILSIGVHNDLLTVTDRYSEMTEFPAPIVGFQLKNNFTITCHFQLFGYYDSNNCSKYLTQPTFNEENDLTTKNDSWYADAAAGFMLDPNSFLLEEQTEQRNKNALSVISNVLSIFGALFTFYALLFGVSSIKPWGFMHKRVFNSTTKKTLNEKLKPKPTLLFSANPEYDNLDLKEELIGLKEFLKLYVINISWLEEDNIKTSKKDDRKTSEEDDRKTSEEDDRKTSDEHDKKTSEEDDKSFPGCGRDDSIKNLTSGKLYKVMEFINNNR
ncbi:hypothetical protein RhiirA5_506647 [Rhizophagus irregularis]|uniref:Uncharacterized protein n=1 Tax=Rhizophagus irregularis TaxID=588596 RepID=A0A2N0NRZ9_9GLOM|nr:hypothetical protein RhiirA5_506647 [Rhizophagus irregularis]